ncbi:polysaccharide deacetylase family protein [Roseisolibacter sp. H3M3-2]|uniref:polysaccharide deacetylase family protein n=1 Tax=Roseisolibacter sp. H3M3-2 TaxID=3031323 RepID=UPI0023DB99C5|nr:polysaccharide deacetylase family protein [Roseisolibacter sp. H3M3-2]MDF1505731.1 polysaccharide deacetylase family protein [Roseisolibacter sp. H3M3-2]
MPRLLGAAVRRAGVTFGLDHALRRRRRHELLAVCYHGIRRDDAPDRHWLLLPESAFERQIAYLAAHYDCLPVDEAVDRLRAGTLTRPTACVTFDDGYANNLHLGLPILRRHGVPATIYLATALVGTDLPIWTVAVEDLFTRTTRTHVDLAPFGGARVALGDRGERVAHARAVVERLKAVPATERRARVAALAAELAPAGDGRADPPFALLDWDQVAELAASGLVTFGGHTATHEIVGRLDDAALDAEVGESVRAVARAVPHASSRTFAYPNGRAVDFDARAEAVLARHGCTAAFSTIDGLCDQDTPPFALRRLVVGGADVDPRWFAMRAVGV